MEPRRIEISTEAIAELVDLLPEGGGLDQFRSGFRAFIERHGWDWFPLLLEREFNGRARLLYWAVHSVRYAETRLRQLEDGNRDFWIFKAGGCSAHMELDSITLSPTNEFWRVFSPPLDWECGCYILGTSSRRGVERLGGSFDKRPPADGEWIDPIWRGSVGPDLLTILAAIMTEALTPFHPSPRDRERAVRGQKELPPCA